MSRFDRITSFTASAARNRPFMGAIIFSVMILFIASSAQAATNGVTITPNVPSPQVADVLIPDATVVFNATGIVPATGQDKYRFLLKERGGTYQIVQNFSTNPQWTWHIANYPPGRYVIKVVVKARTSGGTIRGVATARFRLNPMDETLRLGATLFAENLCSTCHGDDGSGNPGPNIQGEAAAAEIRRAMKQEEVHRGIQLTNAQVKAVSTFLNNPVGLPQLTSQEFTNPAQCRICHPRQFDEWQGNMMAYGAISPVFSALEFQGNTLTNGALAKGMTINDKSDLFCQRCHNPVDSMLDNLPTFADSAGQPLMAFASEIGRQGLSCDFCHQVSAPDLTRSLAGDLGDGIANNALILTLGDTKYGSFQQPQANPLHASTNSNYLQSSEFCGACHDVRPRSADVVEGANYQRLENLFTEWQEGPYGPTANNTVGKVVSCQDCHMSEFPAKPPGTYPKDKVSVYPRPREAMERRVSTHYFTGVDVALIPFPGQDNSALDTHGLVIGQSQRREELLKAAATIGIAAPSNANSGGILPITIDVTNVGAGHNIPSGFSQERQLWIELTVKDAAGAIVYQSGHLTDSAHPETGELVPDGNLDDEDLKNLIVEIDPATGEATTLEHGPDYNQRHGHPPANLGLANFGNEFLRVDPVTGEEEEVFIPFLSNHVDNSHSIPPLETEHVQYDIPVPAGTVGPLSVTARLRFRPFPPRFLRMLAQVRPDLLNEALVDRNRIIEMASAAPVTVTIIP